MKTHSTYEHYKMIHEAVQSCHSYSWQLTAIYVPAIGAGIYMLARGADAFLSTVTGVLLIGLTLYWYFTQVALDRFNKARYELLEKLEKELFTGDCEWMAYYDAIDRRKRSWYANLKLLRRLILAAYVLTIGLVMWANLSSERPERERREISEAMDSATPKGAAIGIGTPLTERPSHTTQHTGPYCAVRLIRQNQTQGNTSPSDHHSAPLSSVSDTATQSST